ncbi:MAG TPA: hypothetical protein V6D28_06675 [Leptolyngbyaceae cyanobacterium]
MKLITKQAIAAFCITALMMSGTTKARAGDHNNIDANRPLSFDDAESIGYREQAIEMGASLLLPRDGDVGGELEIEYVYGFARNTHFHIGINPSIGGSADTKDTRFDPGNVSVGIFHNFNREYNNTPAFAVRADAHLPTGRDASGVDLRLRGIASKTVGQYDRLHLNLDLNVKIDADSDERAFVPGVVLGYSRPLGYPRRFDRTFVAEVGVRGGEHKGDGAIASAGVGLRQQVGYQSVVDIGLQTDFAGDEGDRSQLRLTAGYSFSF